MTTQPAPTQPLPGGPGSDVQATIAAAFPDREDGQPLAGLDLMQRAQSAIRLSARANEGGIAWTPAVLDALLGRCRQLWLASRGAPERVQERLLRDRMRLDSDLKWWADAEWPTPEQEAALDVNYPQAPTPDQLPPPPGLPRGFVMPNYGHPLLGQDPNANAFVFSGFDPHTAAQAALSLGPGPDFGAPSEDQTAKTLMEAAAKDPRLAKLLQSFVTDSQERQGAELRRYKRLTASFLRSFAELLEAGDEEAPTTESVRSDFLTIEEAQRQAAEAARQAAFAYSVPSLDEVLANERGY